MASSIISPADRIRELNIINEDVPAMLRAAGHAVAALSPKGYEAGNDTQMTDAEIESDGITSRKRTFEENAKAFYVHVQAVAARLRRQAYAMEEAGIIASESQALSSSTQQGSGTGQVVGRAEVERISNGGLGSLDVGLLNSRGNKVGAEKEAELMAEAKDLLTKLALKTDREHDVADA